MTDAEYLEERISYLRLALKAFERDPKSHTPAMQQVLRDEKLFLTYIESLKGKVDKWKKAVEGLTPSGSEFVDDPEFCGSYIKDLIHSHFEGRKQAVLRQKELQAEVESLKQERDDQWESWHSTCDSMGNDIRTLEGKLASAERVLAPIQEIVGDRLAVSTLGRDKSAGQIHPGHRSTPSAKPHRRFGGTGE